MKNLYSFYWDCGRMGSLDGLFISDYETVKAVIGKNLYFGEVLGKHSEIFGTLDEKDLTLVSSEDDKIAWLEGIMGGMTISGFNPLEYIRDEDEEEE